MSLQTWQEAVGFNAAQGSSFATFTTAKTVLPAGSTIDFPKNYFYPGKMLRCTVQGAISNIVTTPGTIAFQLMMNAVIAWTSGNIQLNATAHTLLPFELQVLLRCAAIGAGTSANFLGIGRLHGVMFTRTAAQVDQVNIGDSMLVPITAPAAGTGWDSTLAQTLDFFAGFSISNAANLIRLDNWLVEALN